MRRPRPVAALGLACSACCLTAVPELNASSASSSSGGAAVSVASSRGGASSGAGGACVRGQQLCDGACVDTQTDNANCGGCGLACTATAPSTTQGCSGGKCLVTLASVTGNDYPQNIAVGGGSVFWEEMDTNGSQFTGALLAVPIGGGSVVTIAPLNLYEWGGGVAADADSVYWISPGPPPSENNAIMKARPDGTNVTTLATSPGASGITVDATSLYWTGDEYDGGWVERMPLDGGLAVTLVSSVLPEGVGVGPGAIVWMEDLATLYVAKLDGGDARTLASDPNTANPFDLAVDATRVYWTDEAGAVLSVRLDGTGLTTIASGEGYPYGTAIDATSVYWVNDLGGTVMKAALDGGALTTLASGRSYPGGVAIDETSVYWVEGGSPANIAVMKLTPK